jgi:tripartite-type tricarboxylate transporter receptor subunit TctC
MTLARRKHLAAGCYASDHLADRNRANLSGAGAPSKTAADVIVMLNNEINVLPAAPKLIARFADLGLTPFPGSVARFAKFIAEETEKWGKVIRAANIKAE